jgi:hypothetical protein
LFLLNLLLINYFYFFLWWYTFLLGGTMKMASLRLLYSKITRIDYSLLVSGTLTGKMVTLAASDFDNLEFIGYILIIFADLILVLVGTIVLYFYVGLATFAYFVIISLLLLIVL